MSVVYSNFCGMVVSENRGGVVSDYVHDTLGNTIGLMDSAGTMTDRWEYWPYGEVVSRTGTNPTPLTFLGVIGYFQDVLSKLFYVRARHLRVDLARWLTSDPFWPSELAFAYAWSGPVQIADPTGHASPGSGMLGSVLPWPPCDPSESALCDTVCGGWRYLCIVLKTGKIICWCWGQIWGFLRCVACYAFCIAIPLPPHTCVSWCGPLC